MPAIEIENLTRIYETTTGVVRRQRKEIVALDSIDLMVEEGELFGLLGPNGAGKTTLTKILATILLPTSGSVRILGYLVFEARLRTARQKGSIESF